MMFVNIMLYKLHLYDDRYRYMFVIKDTQCYIMNIDYRRFTQHNFQFNFLKQFPRGLMQFLN